MMVAVNQINNLTTMRPSLYRELISSQYQNYSVAFLLTILIGCCLLTLNVLIFCAIYYQRGKRKKYANRKKIISNNIDDQSAAVSPSPQSREKRLQTINQKGNNNNNGNRVSHNNVGDSRRCPTHEMANCNSSDKSHQSNTLLLSRQSKRSAPYEGSNEIHKMLDMRASHNSLMLCNDDVDEIPEAPPPPRSRTPKKRVQIQEISV